MALVRNPNSPTNKTISSENANIEFRAFALPDEPEKEIFKDVDVLIHCAYDFVVSSWDEINRVNVEGGLKLFRAAREAGVKRIIFISTMSAFEGCKSLYGKAKLKLEQESASLGVQPVRPGLVYGDSPGGMVGALNGLLKLPVIPLVGMGNQILYLIEENNLGELLRYLSVDANTSQNVIIGAHERGFRFKDILKILAARLGKKPVFIPIPWVFLWAPLKILELLGVKMRTRSDSLISLINQDAEPNFSETRKAGMKFKDFSK